LTPAAILVAGRKGPMKGGAAMVKCFLGPLFFCAVATVIWLGCAHKEDPHDLPPEDYVYVQCTRCHSVERICSLIQTKKVETWEVYVDMMEKKYHAKFTPEGKEIISRYLENTAADKTLCP
jgi:hypothetical protein